MLDGIGPWYLIHIGDNDDVIIMVLKEEVGYEDANTIYKVLHTLRPDSKILVMSENWLQYVKGGNRKNEQLNKLVEAYEAYLHS